MFKFSNIGFGSYSKLCGDHIASYCTAVAILQHVQVGETAWMVAGSNLLQKGIILDASSP